MPLDTEPEATETDFFDWMPEQEGVKVLLGRLEVALGALGAAYAFNAKYCNMDAVDYALEAAMEKVEQVTNRTKGILERWDADDNG